LRAKFKGDYVKDFGYGSKEVQLSAVYSNKKNTEDNEFSQATPSGTITMMISNPKAYDFIIPGRQYYVDFTLVPEEDNY